MMCGPEKLSGNAEFLRRFSTTATSMRVPLQGGMDLTSRCNMSCVHCYAGPAPHSEKDTEVDTESVIRILDQVADAGCLFFLFSGGEPLLRDDFSDVYAHARGRGMIVSVFTNATLVDDRIVGLFSRMPPYSVEVTMYGVSPEVHDSVTRVRGSHEACMRGVRMLKDAGFRVVLKTILMRQNRHEFESLERLAGDLGLEFRMDPMLFPRMDGDPAPLEFLVEPGEAVAAEMSGGNRMGQWREYADKTTGVSTSGKMYDCGAGVSTFHVDSRGVLHPCLMARNVGYDLTQGSFETGWNDVIPSIREKQARQDDPCGSCGKRGTCSYCPASFDIGIGGNEYRKYACDVSEKREQVLKEQILQA